MGGYFILKYFMDFFISVENLEATYTIKVIGNADR